MIGEKEKLGDRLTGRSGMRLWSGYVQRGLRIWTYVPTTDHDRLIAEIRAYHRDRRNTAYPVRPELLVGLKTVPLRQKAAWNTAWRGWDVSGRDRKAIETGCRTLEDELLSAACEYLGEQDYLGRILAARAEDIKLRRKRMRDSTPVKGEQVFSELRKAGFFDGSSKRELEKHRLYAKKLDASIDALLQECGQEADL